MLTDQIKELVASGIPGSRVNVETDGYKYHVVVVAEQFRGLSPVKKQQTVYACINHLIADGTLHAVTMQTLTPEEWQSKQA